MLGIEKRHQERHEANMKVLAKAQQAEYREPEVRILPQEELEEGSGHYGEIVAEAQSLMFQEHATFVKADHPEEGIFFSGWVAHSSEHPDRPVWPGDESVCYSWELPELDSLEDLIEHFKKSDKAAFEGIGYDELWD